jgi:hypothetical protein
MTMLRLLVCSCLLNFAGFLVAAEQTDPKSLTKLASPVGGHIHPAICRTAKGTLIVTYGQVNHRDLRILRSTDDGKNWTQPEPFTHTIKKSYYPGSLTALADGRIVHCWNRWSTDTNEMEPRSVLYSLSSDDGLSWGEPQPLPRDEKVRSVIRHPFVELDPDRWLFSLDDRTFIFRPASAAAEKFGDGRLHGLTPIVRTPKGSYISGKGLRSTDNGLTWQEIKGLPDIKTQGWRHELVCLSNGWLLASEILGPGVGGERIRYVISTDDGVTWGKTYEYYNPGRAIGGRACPRTVELNKDTIGVVFYDVDPKDENQKERGLFFLQIPLAKLN